MATNAAPILIKRSKKGHHEAHHGGAWKVAYADFVTAMMAFFLLLWLLNSTTQEQRSGISEYFAPASVARTESGSGGILGGQTVTLDGPQQGKGAPLSAPVPMPPAQGKEGDRDAAGEIETGAKENPSQEPENAGAAEDVTGENLDVILAQREERMFKEAEKRLREAIKATPALNELADNLVVDRTEEGLRIQIVDGAKKSMFPNGSAVMYAHTRQLLTLVARVVAGTPNKLALAGHTDATPYARGSSYTNWELSTDRAHASRRELLRAGLDAERVTRVVGKADTEPLISDDPTSPRNRRISITLLRQAPPPPKVVAETGKDEAPPNGPPPPVAKGVNGPPPPR